MYPLDCCSGYKKMARRTQLFYTSHLKQYFPHKYFKENCDKIEKYKQLLTKKNAIQRLSLYKVTTSEQSFREIQCLNMDSM